MIVISPSIDTVKYVILKVSIHLSNMSLMIESFIFVYVELLSFIGSSWGWEENFLVDVCTDEYNV